MTTVAGAEGLEFEDGVHLLVADDAWSFRGGLREAEGRPP